MTTRGEHSLLYGLNSVGHLHEPQCERQSNAWLWLSQSASSSTSSSTTSRPTYQYVTADDLFINMMVMGQNSVLSSRHRGNLNHRRPVMLDMTQSRRRKHTVGQ